jgi:hypothetical protein
MSHPLTHVPAGSSGTVVFGGLLTVITGSLSLVYRGAGLNASKFK